MYPAARNRAAMFPPMCPRPTNPIFVVVVAISCPPFEHHDVIVAAPTDTVELTIDGLAASKL
ncbi:MAG TPA: hypothetical protein VNL97_01925 [Solirubrobacterales bacterium]|nr:hypothetical protein [Solirubrobacterales bacterium]